MSMNVKKSVCDCGYCFTLKHKVAAKKVATRCRRALETTVETVLRKEKNRAHHMARTRAFETPNDTM